MNQFLDVIYHVRCLDIKKLWKSRDSPFAWMDSRGWYDVINCDKCSNGGWLSCSSDNKIIEFGVAIQAKDNDFLQAIKERMNEMKNINENQENVRDESQNNIKNRFLQGYKNRRFKSPKV